MLLVISDTPSVKDASHDDLKGEIAMATNGINLADARTSYHTDANAAALDAKGIRQINADVKKSGGIMSLDQQHALSDHWKSYASNIHKAGADLADINKATGRGNTADKGEVAHDASYLAALYKFAAADTLALVNQWHEATGTNGTFNGVNGDPAVGHDVGGYQTDAYGDIAEASVLSRDRATNTAGAEADATRDTAPLE